MGLTSILIRQITNAHGTANTQNFLSIPNVSPIANETICVGTHAESVSVSSISGCGIVFARVLTTTVHSGQGTTELWTGSSPTPSTGTLTVTFSAICSPQGTVCGILNSTGTGQTQTANDTGPATTLTLASITDTNSIVLSMMCIESFNDQTITAGSGMTALDSVPTFVAQTAATEYVVGSKTVTWTTGGTASNFTGSWAVEFKASGSNPPQQNSLPSATTVLRIPYYRPHHEEVPDGAV